MLKPTQSGKFRGALLSKVGGTSLPIIFSHYKPSFLTVDDVFIYFSPKINDPNCDDLWDLFTYSEEVFSMQIDGRTFLVGKGFVGILNGENVEPLIYITNAGNTYFKRITDEVVPEFRLRFLKEYVGNLTIEDSISRYFGVRPELPQFRTIKERKEFIDDIIASSLDDLSKGY